MDTYTLTKEKKGSKYLYTIIAPDGREVKRRLSAHNYVAATCDGQYFFGRRDLIGKGSHGYLIARYKGFLSDLKVEKTKSEAPTASQEYRELIAERILRAEKYIEELTTIAYLQPCEAKE